MCRGREGVHNESRTTENAQHINTAGKHSFTNVTLRSHFILQVVTTHCLGCQLWAKKSPLF